MIENYVYMYFVESKVGANFFDTYWNTYIRHTYNKQPYMPLNKVKGNVFCFFAS
jgi:hypothetical protein